MKYIIIILSMLMLACSVDYQDNPNESKVVPTDGLLNGAQKRYLDITRGEEFTNLALVWTQQWSATTFTEESRFLYKETTNLELWNSLYGVTQDLKSIIDLNTNTETRDQMSQYGSNETQIAAAQVMMVYVFQSIVEIWGDVPYYSYGSSNESFQANQLSEGIFQPAYAAQEDIYRDMLRVLGECAEVFYTNDYVMDGDNFFEGNATQWHRFANSLKLRIANRIKDILPEAATFIEEVKSKPQLFLQSNSDNVTLTYEANAVNGAPLYKMFQVENRNYNAPSHTLVSLLKGKDYTGNSIDSMNTDPRLQQYFEPNQHGFYVGMPQVGDNVDAEDFTDESAASDEIVKRPDGTLSYIDYSEVCFIMSEINNWDQLWYERGIEASMHKWGVDQEAIDIYMESVAVANKNSVLTQKYIALYMQGLEAWSEYRRTGFPNLLIKPGTSYTMNWKDIDYNGDTIVNTKVYTFTPEVQLNDLPYRNKYPINEENINREHMQTATERMGGDNQDTKLWWME